MVTGETILRGESGGLCHKKMAKDNINSIPEDFVKWEGHFVWIDPNSMPVDGQALHWKKISPRTVHDSFISLEILKPYLQLEKIRTESEVNPLREKLVRLGGSTPLEITEQTLNHFALYFGVNHIEVILSNNQYNIINGRHRIFQAQKERIRQIPVLLREKKITNQSGAAITIGQQP